MRNRITTALGLLALLALSACDRLDSYAEGFGQVAIGDSEARVVELMGVPDSRSRIEAPLVSLEDLAWKSRVSGRVYTIHILLGRVITKSVIE